MYQKDGNPYTLADLRRDNPNVGFPANSLDNESIRSEYGITETPASNLHPTNIQPVSPDTPDGFRAVEGSPIFSDGEWRQTWAYVELSYNEKRLLEYGSAESQIEFITENGLTPWQQKVSDIKAKYPKE